jgi:hypothetical protein
METLRDLSNAFMHDYPDEMQLRADALTQAHATATILLNILATLRNYAERHEGLRLAIVPEEWQ